MRKTGGRKAVATLKVEKVSDPSFRPEAVRGNRTETPANDYDHDDLDWLDDVEYLANQLDVEGFVVDNLGSRTGDQSLRCNERVNCTAESLVAGKNEGRKKLPDTLNSAQGE